uniref:Myb2 n=1 Tax=Arundo donax TaxID=35708 RepID=A0A0A9CMS6_ARUDO
MSTSSFMRSSSRKGVAFGVKPKELPSLEGVMPIRGVAPGPGLPKGVAMGFGVCISFLRGVTPEKSDGCRSGLSPPKRGVCDSRRRARFSASIIMASPFPAGVRCGVRKGVIPSFGVWE